MKHLLKGLKTLHDILLIKELESLFLCLVCQSELSLSFKKNPTKNLTLKKAFLFHIFWKVIVFKMSPWRFWFNFFSSHFLLSFSLSIYNEIVNKINNIKRQLWKNNEWKKKFKTLLSFHLWIRWRGCSRLHPKRDF